MTKTRSIRVCCPRHGRNMKSLGMKDDDTGDWYYFCKECWYTRVPEIFPLKKVPD